MTEGPVFTVCATPQEMLAKNKGEYVETKQYEPGEWCEFGEALWACVQSSLEKEPEAGSAFWQRIAAI